MSHSTHAHVHVVDKGSATPVDVSHGVLTAIPIATDIPLAEFGLAVEQGTFNNFVTLTGTVGVQSSVPTLTTSVDKVILRIYRRNTTPAGPTVLIHETHQSLLGALQEVNVSFSFTDGGADGLPVPTGYHAYTLSIQRDATDPLIVPFTPNVIGPIQFEGTSYTTNIEPVHPIVGLE